jgi:hypothetical protein
MFSVENILRKKYQFSVVWLKTLKIILKTFFCSLDCIEKPLQFPPPPPPSFLSLQLANQEPCPIHLLQFLPSAKPA